MPTAPRARASRPTDPELSEPAARVLRRFRIVFNAVKTHFRDVERKAGIAGAQLWALSVIGDNPGIGVGRLAQAMDIHQSTASNLLKPLLEQELVVADRADADKRSVQLQLSAAGARLLRTAPGPLTGVLPQALAQLDSRTLARLGRDLDTLIGLLDADHGTGGIPLGQPTGAAASTPQRRGRRG